MLKFACISPHAPVLLPTVGSKEQRSQVKKTLESLELLRLRIRDLQPDTVIVSSPHPDWGFNVPLTLIAPFYLETKKSYLTGVEPPDFYFNAGRKAYQATLANPAAKVAVIASGDLSHCLIEGGPYGFNPDGPNFDNRLIELLRAKDVAGILELNKAYPAANECGLRSFAFLLGILKESGLSWQPEILSYEGPFGVGYLVANIKF